MSLLSTAFRFVTGGNKNADKIVDGIIGGIDAAWYTDEERAKDYSKYVTQQIDENSIRSRARRVLAFAILGSYLGLKLVGAAVYKIDANYAAYLSTQGDALSTLALGVGAFYFAVHLLRGIKK